MVHPKEEGVADTEGEIVHGKAASSVAELSDRDPACRRAMTIMTTTGPCGLRPVGASIEGCAAS